MYEESAVSITATKLCQELATVPDQTAVRALLREFKQMKGAASTGNRTILGYYSDGHDIRVNYYSNPAVTYPITGTPTGVEGISNNAAVLRRNIATFSALGDESGACASTTTTTTTIPTTATTTTNGNDILTVDVTRLSPQLYLLLQQMQHAVISMSSTTITINMSSLRPLERMFLLQYANPSQPKYV